VTLSNNRWAPPPYSAGGILPAAPTTVRNDTGRAERVLTPAGWEQRRARGERSLRRYWLRRLAAAMRWALRMAP
jgi:hypothetical protein